MGHQGQPRAEGLPPEKEPRCHGTGWPRAAGRAGDADAAQGQSRAEGLLQGMRWVRSRVGDLYPVFPKKWPCLTRRLLAWLCSLPQHPNGHPTALLPPCTSSPCLLPPAPSLALGLVLL